MSGDRAEFGAPARRGGHRSEGLRGAAQLAARCPASPPKRIRVTLACSVCKARNYRTTKAPSDGAVEMRKFCKQCQRHTLHRETK